MLRLLISISFWLLSQMAGLAWAAGSERIVFINPGARGEEFWENTTLSMQAAAEQLGFELDVRWAARNKFNMQAEGIAAAQDPNKPSLIILVNEERAALPILEATEKAGIKTLFLSNDLSAGEIALFEGQHGPIQHLLGSVVPDMRLAGERMGKALIEAASKKGLQSADGKFHIVAIGGDQISPSSAQRNAGLVDFVKSRDDVKVERFLFANWTEKEAQQLMERFLELMQRKGEKLAGVWAGNDPMAFGAMNALSKAGFKPGEDSVVVGLNWSKEAIPRVQSGEMLLTDGGHFLGGAWLLVAFADHRNGCPVFSEAERPQLKLPTSALTAQTDPSLLKMILEKDYKAIDFKHFLTHERNCQDYSFTPENLVEALKR